MSHETYTLSIRSKPEHKDIFEFIEETFPVEISQVDSVFGFAERCKLYGGRIFTVPQLSQRDIQNLNEKGIGFRIPLTNHYDSFEESKEFLAKYDNGLNSVIVTNDDVAKNIKDNYSYHVEASVIKNLRTLDAVNDALGLYDSVVTPMDLNDDIEFLQSLPKDKVRLFVNAFCTYSCPSKIRYQSFSKINRGDNADSLCSLHMKDRDFKGMVDFDVDSFKKMGFSKFKMLARK